MKAFLFQKWFFDATIANGDYFFIFITRIALFGKDKIFIEAHGGGEELCQAELNSVEVNDNLIKTRQGTIILGENQISLSLNVENFSIEATWASRLSSRPPVNKFMIKKCTGRLRWEPLFINSDVSGEVKINGENKYSLIKESGYVDYVDSTFLPLLMPVKTIYWGRLMSKEIDLTFTIVSRTMSRKQKSKIYLVYNRNVIEFDEVNMVISEQKATPDSSLVYPEKYMFEAQNDGYRLKVDIFDHNISVASDFIKDAKQYSTSPSCLGEPILNSCPAIA